MNEYYVELQDANGTGYGATDITGEVAFFEDVDEARMFAKAKLDDRFILARVIDDRGRVVDFFEVPR